jgi:hypothetical protein
MVKFKRRLHRRSTVDLRVTSVTSVSVFNYLLHKDFYDKTNRSLKIIFDWYPYPRLMTAHNR